MSDKIRKARRSAGLSQKDLAAKVNVSAQAVGNWESGANPPSEDNIKAIAKATKVPVWWFTSDAYPTEPTPTRGGKPTLPKVTGTKIEVARRKRRLTSAPSPVRAIYPIAA